MRAERFNKESPKTQLKKNFEIVLKVCYVFVSAWVTIRKYRLNVIEGAIAVLPALVEFVRIFYRICHLLCNTN